jgi:hypothetical protein
MTKQEFSSKHGVAADSDDVLTIIASNLSDVQHMMEFGDNSNANQRLNAIKEFIFDFRKVERLERLAVMRNQVETI